MISEERCMCGTFIPKGYGYYNYGQSIVCKTCGRINRKPISVEFEIWMELLTKDLENTVNDAYAFTYLHELELIKCFEEQFK
jgi:hypothetical protein